MARRVAGLLALLLASACSGANPGANPSANPGANPGANPDVVPSCLPPGSRPRVAPSGPTPAAAEAPGQELDVLLAVVEGEVITRRRLARQIGGRAPGQDPAEFERQLHRALKERARLLVFVRESQRSGITIRDQLLDGVVEDRLSAMVKEVETSTGERVTPEALLAERGITIAEFRQQAKEQLAVQAYVVKLKEGLGGPTRPQVDMDVSPAEVRRIYRDHPGAFDEKPAVRYAAFRLRVESYLTDDRGFLEAEDAARADAEALAADFGRGTAPEDLATKYRLERGDWRAARENEYLDAGSDAAGLLGEQAGPWLFDAARTGRDATVLSDPEGPVVFGILEQRAGRRIPYEEAYEKIVTMIQRAREFRLVEQRLIEILSSRSVIQPAALAGELVADARKQIELLERDPVAGSARFR
jgi:hypothetical protein